ncbi:glutathione S-transferase [Fennellomyces sp. T-0311]|nr:glutathione S-transferase [Fennellomyces sp. T-0311]
MTISNEGPERKFTLYNAPTSPFGHRVLMAFKEAGVEYELVPVEMENREWIKEIYPEAKIPFVKYGDDVIPESMVIVELVHDLYPSANLFPSADPVRKAKMKFFIRFFEDQVLPLSDNFLSNPVTRDLFDAHVAKMTQIYRRLNDLLLEQAPSGPYFLGTEYSAADIALAPFVFRLTHFINFLTGHDFKVLDELPRLREFLAGILEHPTFKETANLTSEMLDHYIVDRYKFVHKGFAD